MRRVVPGESPPLCLCGCGQQVLKHGNGAGNFWANYVRTHQMRGRQGVHSPEGLLRQSERMKRNNPMHNPEVARRARRTRRLAESPTKIEIRFSEWAKLNKLSISFRGNGKLWVNRRNPDFRVVGQKKVIEIATGGIFNGGAVEPRSASDYGAQSVAHYLASGWKCLVVFCHQDYRRKLPKTLLPVVIDFASPESSWTGVWNYDRLIRSGS